MQKTDTLLAELQKKMAPDVFLTLQQMLVNMQETMCKALWEVTGPEDTIRDKHMRLLIALAAHACGFDEEGAKLIQTITAQVESEKKKEEQKKQKSK